MKRPAHFGLRHLALNVVDMQAMEKFYCLLLGFAVEWRPDANNLYLTSGMDNLALHQAETAPEGAQSLDHLGIILQKADDVDEWHEFMLAHDVRILKAIKTHRDGARSFYCADPDGNVVQFIFHPPLAKSCRAD